ncbi:MAG TPA: hypothetical protein VFX17_03305 [Patescibacteria group bacterium]|nr:hypothetical protein [Patescibacteria group bacterium]
MELEEIVAYLDHEIRVVQAQFFVREVTTLMPEGGIPEDMRPLLVKHYQEEGYVLSFDDESGRVKLIRLK